MFEEILDKDEKVINTFKPDKLKFWFTTIIAGLILAIIVPFCSIYVFLEGPLETILLWSGVAAGAIFLLFCLLRFLHYKKVLYAYTNKRILVRTGIIGTDYQALDMKMIGAVDVYVSLLDKLLGRKTGTIKFGSTANPMNSQSTNYNFSHVKNAYQVYREIKEQIENCKNK